MAGKQYKKKEARPAIRENTPLLFLMLLMVPVYGGYYHVVTFAAGLALTILLLYECVRQGHIRIPAGPEAWCLYGLLLCAVVNLPFAVSWGMALTGLLRVLVWVLFFFYASTYQQEERQDILDTVAYEGAILSLISTVAFLADRAAGIEDANGRMDGPFEYANTWSLFLLVCLVLLVMKETRRRIDIPAMAVLLCGIGLSGSRGVFLLTGVFGLSWGGYWIWKHRKPVQAAAAVGGVMLVGAVTAVLSEGMLLSRLQAITLTSSSLNGRLLYYLDGLRMIGNHPMGLGRLGYLYTQPLEQTGVYTLRYVHNEYLQMALDHGVLAGIALMLLVMFLLFRRGISWRQRVVMLIIAAHACIDFDFQFTAVFFLLLLCGSGGTVREYELPKGFMAKGIGIGLSVIFGYFMTVYGLDYLGQFPAAYSMFPADLSLAEHRMQQVQSVEEAQPIADRILEQTDLSMLAWDCKYGYLSQIGDDLGMVEAKFQYLRLNPYRGKVYMEFVRLLETLCIHSSSDELKQYKVYAQQVIQQLEEVNTKTSPLAYRMADKPELQFSAEILGRLSKILQQGEEKK